MSKEVEVTGIQMTATVPETLEISLGKGTNTPIATSFAGLNSVAGTQIFNNKDAIDAPDTTTNTTDWANTVAFSDHYVAGRLIPASSVDGNVLYKTNDATGVGKTVSKTAEFSVVDSVASTGGSDVGYSDEAQVHVKNAVNDATKSTDDLTAGYYVDFPVWFRTTSKYNSSNSSIGATGLFTDDNTKMQLGVKATITQRSGSDADEDLYHAVRIAVLSGSTENSGSVGVICDSSAAYYDRYGTTSTDLKTELETAIVKQALKADGVLKYSPNTAAYTNVGGLYGGADIVKQANGNGGGEDGYDVVGEQVIAVPLATGTNKYGDVAKYIIRVWIEGEDVNCWNETAGQDFDIALNFFKLSSENDIETNTAASSGGSNQAAPNPGNITVTMKNGDTTIGTFSYPYSSGYSAIATAGSKWNDYTASGKYYGSAIDLATWSLADGTTFSNEDAFVSYLNEYAGKYDFGSALTLNANGYDSTKEKTVT